MARIRELDPEGAYLVALKDLTIAKVVIQVRQTPNLRLIFTSRVCQIFLTKA